MEPERIYSTGQLIEALQSGLVGLKEQLQVLSILDGSASSWPGLGAAVADLESLIALSAKRTLTLEAGQQQLQQANAKLEGQLTGLHHSIAAANSKAQQAEDELTREQQQCRQLQRKLAAAEAAADSSKRQVWELERSRAELSSAVEKAAADGEFMEGELAGVKEQLEEHRQQVSSLREELASRSSELSHTSMALQDNKQQLEDVKAQLAALQQQSRNQLDAAQKLLLKSTDNAATQLLQVQGNLGSQIRQLQSELGQARNEKQQLDISVAQLQQEGALRSSQTEVARLKEFQEVVKRVADDKVTEARAAMAALQQQAKQHATTVTAEIKLLQDRLHQREAESSGLQRQLGLMQVQIREAQRAQAAAAEAQTAAGAALDSQRAELAVLQQKLREAELSAERAKADHAVSESSLRESSAAEVAGLRQQLDDTRREAAVARAKTDAMQRDKKVLQERVEQLEASSAAASSAAESARASAAQERLALHAAAAAQEAALRELKVQLDDQKQEVKHVRLEAASMSKRYEQALQRLRREADAGAEEVRRLHQMYDTATSAAATVSAAATAAATNSRAGLLGLQQQPGTGSPPSAANAGSGYMGFSMGYSAGNSSGRVPGQGLATDVPAHIQREIDELKSYIKTLSGNLQAADAAMQAVAAAARSKQSSPQLPTLAAGPAATASLPATAGQLAATARSDRRSVLAELAAVKPDSAAGAATSRGLQQRPATLPKHTTSRSVTTGSKGTADSKVEAVAAKKSSSSRASIGNAAPHKTVPAAASAHQVAAGKAGVVKPAARPPAGTTSAALAGNTLKQGGRGQPASKTTVAVLVPSTSPGGDTQNPVSTPHPAVPIPAAKVNPSACAAQHKHNIMQTLAAQDASIRVENKQKTAPTTTAQHTSQQPLQQKKSAVVSSKVDLNEGRTHHRINGPAVVSNITKPKKVVPKAAASKTPIPQPASGSVTEGHDSEAVAAIVAEVLDVHLPAAPAMDS